MGNSDQTRRLLCARCGEVIGTYEPLVVVHDGSWRETSQAAERAVGAHGEHYHGACFRDGASEAQHG